MNLRAITTAALVAVLIVAASGTALADRNVFISEGKGETIDLSELFDGETRTIGEGEDVITAVREGDVVRVNGMREKGAPHFACNVTTDDCKVIIGGDSGRTMVMISRGQNCEDGKDCHTVDVSDLAVGEGVHAEGHQMSWVSATDCEDGEDCPEVKLLLDGIGGAGAMGNVMHLRMHTEGTVVRCPEGDTTIKQDDADKDGMFLCPKHSVPLEKVDRENHTMRKIEFRGEPQLH